MTTACTPLYARAVTAATATGMSDAIDTSLISSAALDVTVLSFTGGTTPNITFSVQRLGMNGAWYTAAAGSAISAAGAASYNLGPDTATPVVFTSQCRIVWTFGGAVAATSITFGVSLVGRN